MTSGKRKRPDTNDENHPPRATPAAPQRKPLRGMRGALERVLDAPVEIAYEIFSHLDPGALLNMARCSKDLRERLLTKEVAWLWAQCRQNVDLPDCPPHLSEPAYADLVYCKRCHDCSKAGVSKIIWEASARYCDKCVDGRLVGIRLFFKDPANKMYFHLEDLLLTVKINNRLSFHKPDLLKLYSAWENLQGDTSREEFVASQKEHLEVLRTHVEACQEWKRSTDVDRTEELHRIRDQRFSFIKAKLLEHGYSDALLMYAERKLRMQKQVRACTPLDNKSWRRIRAQMVSFMEDIKLSQSFGVRIKEFADILGQVKAEYLRDPDIRWWPGTVDLLLMQGTSYRTRLTNGPVSVEDHLELKAEIRQDITQWLADRKEELENFVHETKDGFFPVGIQAVDLAICVFRCRSCIHLVRFPEVLVHPCLRGLTRDWEYIRGEEVQQREDLFEKTVLETLNYCPWSLTRYACYLNRGQLHTPEQTFMLNLPHYDYTGDLFEIIRLCGKDPFHATWDDMDKRNPVFSRRIAETRVSIMGWRHATLMNRIEIRDWQIDYPLFHSAASDFLQEQRRLPSQYLHVQKQRVWCCTRCADQWISPITYTEMMDHVRKSHHKAAKLQDGDIYCSPDDWKAWMGLHDIEPKSKPLATPATVTSAGA